MRTWIQEYRNNNQNNQNNQVIYEENLNEWKKYQNQQAQQRNQILQQAQQQRNQILQEAQQQRQIQMQRQNNSRNRVNDRFHEEPTQLSSENIPLQQPQTRLTNRRPIPIPRTPTLRKKNNFNARMNNLTMDSYKTYIEPKMEGAPVKRRRNYNLNLTNDLFENRRLWTRVKKHKSE